MTSVETNRFSFWTPAILSPYSIQHASMRRQIAWEFGMCADIYASVSTELFIFHLPEHDSELNFKENRTEKSQPKFPVLKAFVAITSFGIVPIFRK